MLPLTTDQARSSHLVAFAVLAGSTLAKTAAHLGMSTTDTTALEAQCVAQGLMRANTLFADPRYVIEDPGVVFLVLARNKGIALTADAVQAAITQPGWAGDSSTVEAALEHLNDVGLVLPTAGYSLTV